MERTIQHANDRFNATSRSVISLLIRFVLIEQSIRDHKKAAQFMIKDHHRVREEEHRLRKPEIIFRRSRHRRLELRNRIITHVADSSAEKGRRVSVRDRLVGRHQALDFIENIALANSLLHFRSTRDADLVSFRNKNPAWLAPHDRPSPACIRALGTLKEESMLSIPELHKCRHRGLKIGG